MDVSELTSFVEAHPDDHEQRWRLAKKLYMDCEYREALDHLQILRNEWRPRVNVTRYLAATCYRLGRYEDALKELTTALQRWPDEVALKEQAARVYEVTDRIPQALAEWQGIQALNPDHPMVARSIQRLEALLSDEAPIGDSDSGIDIGGLVCAVCGAQNSIEFSRCWQCHALLDERAAAATPAPHAPSSPRSRTEGPRERIVLPVLVAAFAVIALDAYLTTRHFQQLDFSPERGPHLTLRSLLEHEFAVSRIAVGVGLMLLWPAAVWIAVRTIDPTAPFRLLAAIATGLLAASVTYLTTWVPGMLFLLAPALGGGATFALMWYFLDGQPGRVLGAWALQGVLATAVVIAGVVAFHGIGPVRDFAALVRFANASNSADGAGVHAAPDLIVNRPLRIVWESSGSPWLNARAFKVRFVVLEAPLQNPLYIEMFEDETILAGRNVDSPRVEFTESPIVPGTPYEVLLSGPDGTAPVTLRIYSLLRPVF